MLKQEPGPRLIYLPFAEPETLAECLVALANADGGLIVLGVDAQGRPSDAIWEEEAEGALREAASYCRPPVPTQWQPIETSADTFIGLNVPRSTDLHSLEDGRVLIRSGRQNRALTGDEIRHLAISK
ncbi:MAG: ATP-binding protein, partial [Anaerolineae bacterium]|nr:ATP-binding protein [Anaerolineae bacterium]